MLFIDLFGWFLANIIMINAQTCYYPDGLVSPRDTPCHSPSIGDGASACCGYSDICLDNNLCLAQTGSEVISRGSCTDQNWQSPECSQICSDVNLSGGATVQLQFYSESQQAFVFCCSPGNAYNSTCVTATKGSYAPFPVTAGQVIYNRTSGSTSPDNTNAATTTTTATATITATASALKSLSANSTSSNSSSGREAAVGAGVGVPLGLALLVTFGLLWRERKHKQSLRNDLQRWEEKYGKLLQTQNVLVDIGGAEHQPPQQLDGWRSNELHGQPYLPHQLDGWRPGEIDGRQVS